MQGKKIFCTAKETINKTKRQPTKQDNILANESNENILLIKELLQGKGHIQIENGDGKIFISVKMDFKTKIRTVNNEKKINRKRRLYTH